MKNILRICASAALLIGVSGCTALAAVGTALDSFGRGLATGSAAVVFGAVGMLLGPLGAAIGAFSGACITYLFAEHSAVDTAVQKERDAAVRVEGHKAVLREASGLAWQLIVLGLLVGALVVYWKHGAVRARVNSAVRGAWGTFRAWFAFAWKATVEKLELQQTDSGRKTDAGS